MRHLDRAPCAARCQADREGSAAQVHMEVSHNTKINLHPLRATSRARFRPSSLSSCCIESEENRTSMLDHTRAHTRTPRYWHICLALPISTMRINEVTEGRTARAIMARWRERPSKQREGLKLEVFSLTKTFGFFGFLALINDLHILCPPTTLSWSSFLDWALLPVPWNVTKAQLHPRSCAGIPSSY